MANNELIYEMLKGQYNFKKDLSKNHSHEDWACKYIVDSKLALKATLVDSTDKINRKVLDMIIENPNHIAEIKKDIGCFKSGNIFFETESRGNFSGITTTKSDWWFQSYYCIDGKMRTGIAETKDVRDLLNMPGFKKLSGGDKKNGHGVSTGILVPWDEYQSNCFHVSEMDILDYLEAIGLAEEYKK
ncbi:MAG: hypothetical protein WC523_04000 [Patescibacteria group bacterium]